ncbi:hypothetical protein N9N67_12020 [Bacteriovoracaceae bacterium]|nr:hypothetical protein [Bacteriovoracaceae bacterium]
MKHLTKLLIYLLIYTTNSWSSTEFEKCRMFSCKPKKTIIRYYLRCLLQDGNKVTLGHVDDVAAPGILLDHGNLIYGSFFDQIVNKYISTHTEINYEYLWGKFLNEFDIHALHYRNHFIAVSHWKFGDESNNGSLYIHMDYRTDRSERNSDYEKIVPETGFVAEFTSYQCPQA